MTFDFSRIRATKYAKRLVHPIEIFQSATVSEDVAANALPLTLRPNLANAFESRQLLWLELFDSMSQVNLRDMGP